MDRCNMRRLALLLVIILSWSVLLFGVHRELVVVELFTSTTCTGCPGAATGVNDLILNGHPVAVMTNHINDPFENLATQGRRAFYDNPGMPTAYFDGLDPCTIPSGMNSLYPEYLPKVNARAAVPSNYILEAAARVNGLSYDTMITIHKAETDINTALTLHAAVIESSIPHTWMNHTTVECVNRAMFPDYQGTTLEVDSLLVGERLSVPLTIILKEDWVRENCKVIFWLQNPETREILQGKQYSMAELAGLVLPSPRVDISLMNGILHLTWEPVPGAIEYHIYKSGDPAGPFLFSGRQEQAEYYDRVLNGQGAAFYRVKAVAQP